MPNKSKVFVYNFKDRQNVISLISEITAVLIPEMNRDKWRERDGLK